MSSGYMTLQLVVGIAVLLFAASKVLTGLRKARRGKLPPGPPGLPLLGNLHQLPTKHLGSHLRKVIREYGNLVSFDAAGVPLILLGDMQIAKHVLEKHSAKNASRPILPFVRDHVDATRAYWGTFQDGDRIHSIGRKLTAGLMSQARSGKTEPLQEFEALLNIQHLLDDGGKEWFRHMERIAGRTVIAIGFGVHCPSPEDPDVDALVDVVAEFISMLPPASSIINVLPILNCIPGPMPWRTRTRTFREREHTIYTKLCNMALSEERCDMNSWATIFARQEHPEVDQLHLLKQVCAAAIDTPTVSMQVFVLACILYPDWIPAAQAQIDAVVGLDRLPTFKDRPSLPYVDAILREVLRWRPAARSGFPHEATADDMIVYEGQEYFIPKGSIIFAPPWAIEHSQSKYEDPDRFVPERFLDAERRHLKPDYSTSVFGFGRRVCPGIPFAERSIWIGVATLLWTFNIRASEEIPFQYDDSDEFFWGDFTTGPSKFPAIFEPRSQERVEVARKGWAECEKDLSLLLPKSQEM